MKMIGQNDVIARNWNIIPYVILYILGVQNLEFAWLWFNYWSLKFIGTQLLLKFEIYHFLNLFFQQTMLKFHICQLSQYLQLNLSADGNCNFKASFGRMFQNRCLRILIILFDLIKIFNFAKSTEIIDKFFTEKHLTDFYSFLTQ